MPFVFQKLYEPIISTLRTKQEDVSATVIQRAYRRRLLQRAIKLASYKYRERTKGRRNEPSPPETEGLICRRISQLYGDNETVSGVRREDCPIQVELQREFLLHATPPLNDQSFLQEDSLKESVV